MCSTTSSQTIMNSEIVVRCVSCFSIYHKVLLLVWVVHPLRSARLSLREPRGSCASPLWQRNSSSRQATPPQEAEGRRRLGRGGKRANRRPGRRARDAGWPAAWACRPHPAEEGRSAAADSDDEQDDDYRPGVLAHRVVPFQEAEEVEGRKARDDDEEEEEEAEETDDDEEEDEEFESDEEDGVAVAGEEDEEEEEDDQEDEGDEDGDETVVDIVTQPKPAKARRRHHRRASACGWRRSRGRHRAGRCRSATSWRRSRPGDGQRRVSTAAAPVEATDAPAAEAAASSAASSAAPSASASASAPTRAPDEVPAGGGRDARVLRRGWGCRTTTGSGWPRRDMRRLAEIKLRNFLKLREMSSAGSIGEQERAEMRMGGERLDEVVQAPAAGGARAEAARRRRDGGRRRRRGQRQRVPAAARDDQVLVKWAGLSYAEITWEKGACCRRCSAAGARTTTSGGATARGS